MVVGKGVLVEVVETVDRCTPGQRKSVGTAVWTSGDPDPRV